MEVSWDPVGKEKIHFLKKVSWDPLVKRKIFTSSERSVGTQFELSAGNAEQDVDNTPKSTCPNCNLARRSSLGLLLVGRHRTLYHLN